MNLLAPWNTPFDLPPFGQFTDDDFAPALDQSMADARVAMDAVAANQDPPTFENVIEAMEIAERPMGRAASLFFILAGADSSDKREDLQREFSPKFAKYSADIAANKALFARIDALWQARDDHDLSPEQHRVLMLSRRGFVRSGAQLHGAQADRLKTIMERLAHLGTSFSQNLLGDERDWFMALEETDLDGLPDFVVQTARAAGTDKGLSQPVVTLSRSLIVPFLQFSTRRDLREKAYNAWTARGANGGDRDNIAIAQETLALRAERAALLGYDSFADYKLNTEMAKSPARVRDLLMQVWKPAVATANADADVLAAMMAEDGVNGPLKPWDWRHYAEKRRQAEHDLDEAELKPYLQLDNMIAASFDCASQLFGLDFAPVDVPMYHADARAWEVTKGGQHVAIFIGDYFARGSKRSGAWCTAFQSQARKPNVQAPIVLNVCNFAKPSAGQPALLSMDDARTLFHEFGHALHQMLSDVDYEAVSGTSVARDFVELPSQLYEHWLEVPDVLQKYAVHADTGQAMPKALLDRVLGAATFDMGFQTVEYVASALVDLSYHEGAVPDDIMARQAEILDGIGMPAAIGMRHATPHFAHVFSGDGYSSGYYSYMWSEVMDADAFESFEEAGGPFDADRAQSLYDNILSKGGSEDAEVLYTKFRGRMPDAAALLRNRGLAAE